MANAVRGHAAEFGIIAAKGIAQVEPLLAKMAEANVPHHGGQRVTFQTSVPARHDPREARKSHDLACFPSPAL